MGIALRSYQNYERNGAMPTHLMASFARAADCDPLALILSGPLGLPSLGLWSADNKFVSWLLFRLRNLEGELKDIILAPDAAAGSSALDEALATLAARLRGAKVLGQYRDATSQGEELKLTDRQLECLRWVQAGKSSADIGQILGVSPRTVDDHISKICKQMGFRTRLQAVAHAVAVGVLVPSP